MRNDQRGRHERLLCVAGQAAGVVLVLVFFVCSARAQTVGASLRGSIYDPSGAVVPNAQIEIRNVATGALHALVSDEQGRYQQPLLGSGQYEMRVSAAGFKTVLRKGIVLTVGQDATVDITLELGGTTEAVSVTSDAPRINLVSGALSGLVEQKQMRDLPLNGRSFQQLALLHPGVGAALAAGNDAVGGRTPKISINGARPEQSSFLLDGTDINNVYNKTPGSVGGVLLGVEGVLEFQVLTNSYSAEFGRSSGGVINAVTRSGTNQFHGTAFEFHRNSLFDAKNFFDDPYKSIPPFKRNQFGGTLGGPIRRDKTFFFGSFESLIERLSVTGRTNVPDLNARRGIIPGQPPITLHPLIPQYLDIFFPLPNLPGSRADGVGEYAFTQMQPTDEYYAQGRIDHRFSSKDSLYGRYTFDNGNVDRPVMTKPPVVITKERSRNQYITLEHQHTFSQRLLNTLRVSYSRSTQEADNLRTVAIPPQLSWVPGEKFGYFTIQGVVTEAAGDFRLPRNDHLNNYQWHDALFWTRGAHGLRFGFEGQRLQFNQDTSSQVGGIVNFTSLANFLKGIPSSADLALPGRIDPIRGYRQSVFAFYAQDDYRWKPNFTWNLGLRYEFATTPTEVNGKISNLRTVMDSQLTIGDPWHSNPSLKNFAPRVGLAWDPFKTGKTSVRAGFGIFYDLILPKYYFFSGSLNPPFTTRTTIPNPPFPNILQGFDFSRPIRAQLQTINFDLQSAYVMQFNLSVQRSLPGNWDVTIGYAGSRGNHLFRIGDANLSPERIINGRKTYLPQLGRRNPNFTTITQRKTDAQSFYHALQVGVVKRLSYGLRAQFSYTYSRSVDDASGINSQDYDNSTTYVIDWYDRKADRGLSSFWTKHAVAMNWSYELPFARSMTGVAGAFLKGWQLNNITTIQVGQPFEVRLGTNRSGNLNTTSFSFHERPDLVPGRSNNPILGNPNRYWDPSAFVLQPINTRGNLGRNTLIGPGLVNFDLSMMKVFALGESRNFQFRAEIFNLFNHPNFAIPPSANRVVSSSNEGRITSTVTTSRQIQLGLKFTF